MATDEWGIDDGWWSNDGAWNQARPSTIAAIRREMAGDGDPDVPPSGPPLWFVRTGEATALDSPAEITLEDGTTVEAAGQLPPDLPLGRHRLQPGDGGPTTTLFVCPPRLPVGERRWGVVAQLYSALSTRSWGVGDFTDLATLGAWVGRSGGTVLGINPLGEVLPTPRRQVSPYSPSSRGFLDPLYLDPDAVVGAAPSKPARRPGLDADGLLDRDGVWASKRAALLQTFRWLGSPEVDGDDDHARFCALVEHYGRGWRSWPEELRHPREDAVERWSLDHLDVIGFWRWLGAQTDLQFDAARDALAADGVDLLGDLTVGVDPEGFDAWVHQDQLALGMSIGAPPDTFNREGQRWGLPPFDPWALRAASYQPFIDMLRHSFRRFGGLRFDHVMGLFRLYWIPSDAGPAGGAYVRYRSDELLDLIVMEATRAGAFVVGEDLGTVEEGVRETLADRGISGTRVGWFDGDLASWPHGSLGTLTTHDLPTVVGAVSGTDDTADPAMAAQLLDSLGVDVATAEADPTAVLLDAHRLLGASGSNLVLATLEDVVGSPDRVNLPGPDRGYPSWRRPLGVPIDQLGDHPIAPEVVGAVADGRSASAEFPQG